jgi:hypothetical protein
MSYHSSISDFTFKKFLDLLDPNKMEFIRKDIIDAYLFQKKNFKDEYQDNIRCVAGNA